jgi:hypothetical protein
MNRLIYPLTALLLGVVASTTASASPQDAPARALVASQSLGRDSFDSSSSSSPRLVKVAYLPVQADAASSSSVLSNPAFSGGTSKSRDGAAAGHEELPQNKGLTFLAGAAVIFVIAKRRLSARKS